VIKMDIIAIIGYVAQFGSVIGVLFVGYKALRMFPTEKRGAELANKKEEASVAEAMEALAERAASRVLAQEDRINAMSAELADLRIMRSEFEEVKKQLDVYRAENSQLRNELETVKSELEIYRIENEELREWAECLIGQLREANITPIAVKSSRKK